MLKKTGEGPGISCKIRRQIENGVLPDGLPLDNILEALKKTKAPNTFEMFGFLSRIHRRRGVIISEGLVSCQLVTNAFALYLVDSLQDSTTSPMDVFRYHAVGTGTTEEDNTQTGLVIEVESRVAGTQIEGAAGTIYKSVATIVFSDTHVIGEHGFFSAPSGGTMLDRSLLIPVDNVKDLDEIDYTYQLAVTAET